MKLSIPLYKFPGPAWDNLLAAVKPGSIVANPGSGPGAAVSGTYQIYLSKMKAAGVEIFGYVTNDKGRRSLLEIEAEVKKWRDWYGPYLTGIFFDELDNSGTPESVTRCQSLDNLLEKWFPGGKTYVNPGTKLGVEYSAYFDYAMTFEGYAADYLNTTRPAWESNPALRHKVVHVVHSCSLAQLPLVRDKLGKLLPGQGYITHDLMPNPWDNLPPADYWTAVTSIPEPNPAPTVSGTITLDLVVNGTPKQFKVTL